MHSESKLHSSISGKISCNLSSNNLSKDLLQLSFLTSSSYILTDSLSSISTA